MILILSTFSSLRVNAAIFNIKNTDPIHSEQTALVTEENVMDLNTETSTEFLTESTWYFSEMHGRLWNEMLDFVEEFNDMCNWNWFDAATFEKNEDIWDAKLIEIEYTYKESLLGMFNSDKAIEALRMRYNGLKRAVEIQKAAKLGDDNGIWEILELYELSARISSVYLLTGEIEPSHTDSNIKIEHFEAGLHLCENSVLEHKDMPQNLKNAYLMSASKVKKQLEELKWKVIATQRSHRGEKSR